MATAEASIVGPTTWPSRRRGLVTTKDRVILTLIYVGLSLGGLVMVFPFIWMALTSFMSLSEVNTISWLPVSWHPENYPEAFSDAPSLIYFRNSLIVVIGQTIPTLILSSAAGYALAQLPIRGGKAILNYCIVPLFVFGQKFFVAGLATAGIKG